MPAKAQEADPLVTVLLAELNNTYTEAKARRTQAVLSARARGITNRQIGEALGISEVAVRGIVQRATARAGQGL